MRPQHEYEEIDRWIRWGFGTRAIARLTGIPRCTIRDWRRKGDPWTRPRKKPGPKPGSSRWAPTDCPLCDDGFLPGEPYAYLLGIYLGDGYITSMPRGVYKLCIVQDLRYPRIINEIAEAMRLVRPARAMRIGRIKKTGCVELTGHWKHWPCLFPQYGPGRKHERPIWLTDWQEEIANRHPHLLLRA